MIDLEQSLFIDLQRCCGCLDCKKICPTEAISSSEPLVEDGTVKRHVTLDVDTEACIFCGQCSVICPTKAISWRENETTVPHVITQGVIPFLDEDIHIRMEKCSIDCGLVCQTVCPVDAVKVKTEKKDGKERIAEVAVDRDRCFYCRKCEPACPYGLISVKSARMGLISFDPRHCPPNCRACTEVCPSGAIHWDDGLVQLDETICVYCLSCTIVCPVDEALEVKRERIQGLSLCSQLWAEMQGKLVSPDARVRLIRENAREKRERAYRTRID
jgi:4Fe-4S ferredoxin